MIILIALKFMRVSASRTADGSRLHAKDLRLKHLAPFSGVGFPVRITDEFDPSHYFWNGPKPPTGELLRIPVIL